MKVFVFCLLLCNSLDVFLHDHLETQTEVSNTLIGELIKGFTSDWFILEKTILRKRISLNQVYSNHLPHTTIILSLIYIDKKGVKNRHIQVELCFK